MAEQLREGTYNGFGASRLADGICFTFEGEKERVCALRLYDKRAGKAGEASYRDLAIPQDYCIGAVRSVCVVGLDARRYEYNYVIDGKLVVDPYARRIIGREKWADYNRRGDRYEVRCGFDFDTFDWQGDRFPEIPRTDMVLYKLHVRGFTKDAAAGKAKKGTFAALAEKIPYLKELGVTTIELMPAYEFEELVPPKHEESSMSFEGWAPQAVTGYQLMQQKEYEEKEKEQPGVNYWGYGGGNYFAPKAGYASGASPTAEFKALVRALHRAGLECVMEMSFDEQTNPNYIVDVLRHWVREYHVDGFHLLCSEAAVASVISDVYLRRSKIFALKFPQAVWEKPDVYPHFYVYNDEFLYVARKMINHIEGNLIEYLNQQKKQHPAVGFVNYFANNNGFTLADVFSYCTKHNEENGEEGVDGNDWNYSVNCGVEGASRKKKIREQRVGLMKQAIASVVLSQGVPLIFAGDEFGNSQGGNNNAYCQDNKCGWVNWSRKQKYEDYFCYVKELLALRRAHPALRGERPLRMMDYEAHGIPDLSYHDTRAWSDGLYPSLQAVGAVYGGAYAGETQDLYVGWNFSQNEAVLALPRAPEGRDWRVAFGSGSIVREHDKVMVSAGTVTVLVTETKKRKAGGKRHAGKA